MLLVVHDQAVVDLIREEDKFLFPGDRHNLLQQFAGVQRASGVIGIDDEDGTGAGGDFPADIRDIWVPVGGFVAGVEHRLGPGDEGDIGPQGVAGTGEQDLITVIEQGGDGELSHFADAIADEDVIGGKALDPLAGFVFHDGLTGSGHAAEIAVTDGLISILQQGVAHAGGHGKAEGGRIAGIEAQDGGSLRDHFHGLHINGAADVGMDLREFFGTDDGLHNGASLLWSSGKTKIIEYYITLGQEIQCGDGLFYEKAGWWVRRAWALWGGAESRQGAGPQGRPPQAAVGRSGAPASPGEAGAPCGPMRGMQGFAGKQKPAPPFAERLAEKQSGAISPPCRGGW